MRYSMKPYSYRINVSLGGRRTTVRLQPELFDLLVNCYCGDHVVAKEILAAELAVAPAGFSPSELARDIMKNTILYFLAPYNRG